MDLLHSALDLKDVFLNPIVGLSPKQIIENQATFIFKNSRFDIELLVSCNLCDLMWFYIKY